MSQLLIDPGAELDSAVIAYTTGAARTLATPRTGTWCFQVQKVGATLGSITWTVVPMFPLAEYEVRAWVTVPLGAGGGLVAEVDRGDGSFVQVGVPLTGPLLGWPSHPGYGLWFPGTFQAIGRVGRFRLRAITGAAGDWTCRLDDLAVTGPMVSSWAAHEALYNAIAGINGVGYYNDLAGRVFLSLVDPEEAKEITKPYVCLPLVDEDERPQIFQRGEMLTTWTVRLYCYVGETSADTMNSGTVEQAYKLKDDIKKSLLLNLYLSGTVTDMEIVSIRSIAGVDPHMRHGEVVFDLLLQQKASAAELGVGV